MEIDNVQVLKPFGPLIMMAQLPEHIIDNLNEIVDVVKDKKDMGSRLAGVIKKENASRNISRITKKINSL